MMKRTYGFTLLEMMMAMAMVAVIGAVGWVAIQTSLQAANLNRSAAEVQNETRNAMLMLTREAEYAVKPLPVGSVELPLGVQGARVIDNGRAFVFQIPTNGAFTQFSAPITYRFVTEDAPDSENGQEFGNGVLNHGEDANGDGMLTRCITRTQSGETQVLGSANNIAFARFEMINDNNTLRVNIVATSRIEPGKPRLARFDLQSDVYLMN